MQFDELVTPTLHNMYEHYHVLARDPHEEGLHKLLRMIPHLLSMGITPRLIVSATLCADEIMQVAKLAPQLLGPMVYALLYKIPDNISHLRK
jgi:hypothetical protein